MTRQQFSQIRSLLGKTQKEMAQLLGSSVKAVQSFEQGWRKVPVHTERQVLFLLAQRVPTGPEAMSCWLTRGCPEDVKLACPAWEFHAGHLCWFVNGTLCHGRAHASWEKKMRTCRHCEVFQGFFKSLRFR